MTSFDRSIGSIHMFIVANFAIRNVNCAYALSRVVTNCCCVFFVLFLLLSIYSLNEF